MSASVLGYASGAREVAMRGRQAIIDRYSMDAYVLKLESVYEGVASK